MRSGQSGGRKAQWFKCRRPKGCLGDYPIRLLVAPGMRNSSENNDAPDDRKRPRGNYCLISPARNEAEYIKNTLDSVLAQTILPKRWIIIDDGSTDETPKILADYAAKHDLMEVHTRTN